MSTDDFIFPPSPVELDLPLDRDLFMRRLIRELSGTLEAVVGMEQAEDFISLVAQRVGEWLDPAYREAYGVSALDVQQLAAVLADLKRRIQGDFSVEECTPERIVLVNRACPFGELVNSRASLCQMTTTVFGTIVAENQGYARIRLDRAIARGDSNCRVVIALRTEGATDAPEETQFFRSLEV